MEWVSPIKRLGTPQLETISQVCASPWHIVCTLIYTITAWQAELNIPTKMKKSVNMGWECLTSFFKTFFGIPVIKPWKEEWIILILCYLSNICKEARSDKHRRMLLTTTPPDLESNRILGNNEKVENGFPTKFIKPPKFTLLTDRAWVL